MKTLKHSISVLMFLLVVNTYSQQGINLLSTEITLHADSITKATLLDSISRLTKIHFSYNPELLGAHQKIKIATGPITILAILKEITDPEKIGYYLLDNQLIFYPMKSDTSDTKCPDENMFIVVKGIVTDRKKEEPIPFCNIAIARKALGTMSNNDGRFAIKIPVKYSNDTLRFSCLGFSPSDIPIQSAKDSSINVTLEKANYHLKTVDVVHYNPAVVLQHFFERIDKNYENEYTLYTTFYREIIEENSIYTNVSEAVVKVLKAPYSNEIKEDLVKFIKGRKSSNIEPFNNIRLKLKGGPYYITKLDVVKNNESFINPEFIQFFTYEFEKKTLLDGRETVVISFTPISNLRELLYEGFLYFDIETWALSRVEFSYTRQGIKEARRLIIEKEPQYCKAIPTNLSYKVQYKLTGNNWYLLSAHSSIEIKIYDREKRQKTRFHSISEILTTNIEKGNLEHFSRKDIFKPSEFFTEKISSYDKRFWESYNVIQPEEELEDAIKNFDNHDLIITEKQ